jgi:hypothetical protein
MVVRVGCGYVKRLPTFAWGNWHLRRGVLEIGVVAAMESFSRGIVVGFGRYIEHLPGFPW